VHAASWGWDLHAADCTAATAGGGANEQAGSSTNDRPQQQQQQQQMPASLSIVPISVGYLGHQQGLIQRYGAAVADLLHHLTARGSSQQHYLQQQQSECPAGSRSESGRQSAAAGGHEVVLIVTSDFTHAGPWYCELPPAGVSLADYMAAQDSPLLQVRLHGPAAGTEHHSWGVEVSTSYHSCPRLADV
jgi:hypothetical protein